MCQFAISRYTIPVSEAFLTWISLFWQNTTKNNIIEYQTSHSDWELGCGCSLLRRRLGCWSFFCFHSQFVKFSPTGGHGGGEPLNRLPPNNLFLVVCSQVKIFFFAHCLTLLPCCHYGSSWRHIIMLYTIHILVHWERVELFCVRMGNKVCFFPNRDQYFSTVPLVISNRRWTAAVNISILITWRFFINMLIKVDKI